MRLLVLGGTAFLGRSVARSAVAGGHDVTCAARGLTGPVPDGVTFVTFDRTDPDAYAAITGDYDAIVDVSSRPSHVRAAVEALNDHIQHWVYVSSASVYADNATPGQRALDAPTLPPAGPEIDEPYAEDNYGPCKVACENAIVGTVGPARAFLCRAGLIIGPEDASGRFTYWPVRMARGGEVLAPGRPDDRVQWVDVRDLADWIVLAAADRVAGAYDGIGTPVTRAEFLADIARGVGSAEPRLTWVDQDFLLSHDVNPWAGPRSLPLWLPLPEYDGFLSRDVDASLRAGLAGRDLADSSRDTLEWYRAVESGTAEASTRTDAPPDGRVSVAGLTADEEAELLAGWHARTP